MKYIVVFDNNHRRRYYDTLRDNFKYFVECDIEKHGGYYKIMTQKQLDKMINAEIANWRNKIW